MRKADDFMSPKGLAIADGSCGALEHDTIQSARFSFPGIYQVGHYCIILSFSRCCSLRYPYFIASLVIKRAVISDIKLQPVATVQKLRKHNSLSAVRQTECPRSSDQS